MRFLAMHRSSPDDEAGIPPSREFIEAMGRLIQEGLESKVFLGGEGLRASTHRARLRFAGGERSVTLGPFAGTTDPVGGVLLVKVASLDNAISWAEKVAAIAAVSEIEIGPVCEPWDLGMCPRPEGDLPIRHLLLLKAPEGADGPAPRTPEARERMRALVDDMTRAGVLLSHEWLQPSAKSVRLKFAGSKRTTLDGPFAESKELIAGFSILRFDTMPEVVAWTDKFGFMFPEVQVDIRPLHEPSDLG